MNDRVHPGIRLVIGNKNYSSWSMCAWLLLRHAAIPFEEIVVDLYSPASRDAVTALGGETGLVPVLLVDDRAIWDTWAITEFVAEQEPAVWPVDPIRRAQARSLAGEVHSGLNALRAAMPCNTRARRRIAERSAEVEADISRVSAIWSGAEGDWLFGRFGAADIMFAPVATRFRTYDVELHGTADSYWRRLLAHPLCQQWFDLGEMESAVIDKFELPKSKVC